MIHLYIFLFNNANVNPRTRLDYFTLQRYISILSLYGSYAVFLPCYTLLRNDFTCTFYFPTTCTFHLLWIFWCVFSFVKLQRTDCLVPL